jgi:MYXO-CTERM domain-containing protein
VDCRGECTGEVTATCQGSCDISGCEARCNVEPGRFDCSAECVGRAEAECSAKCQAEANQGECRAACKATASGECDAACDVQPATADCQARCEAACQGECRAESSVDCQVDCQSSGFASCKADLRGGCEGQCTSEEGALFCDDNYVDHGGNLQSCIDALRAELQIEVSASGSAECVGNECTAEGEASCNCSTPGAAGGATSGALVGILGLGLVAGAVRRRRRR